MDGIQFDSLRDQYCAHGYCVLRNVIPSWRIERLLDVYRTQVVPSDRLFFRQNSSRYTRNTLSPHGYVTEPFLDIHGYASIPDFSERALEIFFDDRLQEALRQVSGASSMNLVQSMMFDLNTASGAHQDSWYIDTVPSGHLVGAWIALEDIHEDAGRFFVVPDTTDVVLHDDPGLRHAEWRRRIKHYVDRHADRVVAPALRRGDVLLWNSRTIHGALPTRDPAWSRKSLTAHFIPSDMALGNLFKTKDFVRYNDFRGHLWFANQPEYSPKAAFLSAVKRALASHPHLLRVLRVFQRKTLADM